MLGVTRKYPSLQRLAVVTLLAASVSLGAGSSRAQQLTARSDHQQQDVFPKSVAKLAESMAAVTPSAPPARSDVKPIQRATVRGPYYVDFRARTAATYGHAFIWYGKTSEKEVEVAGLAPAGDTLPYILGHIIFVPSETGASYGDLDEQYLTASYRVYLNEADAEKVFAYIKHLQETSPLWNAATANCTAFIGRIATFMGLKAPFHLLKPEEYVNQLRELNGGRKTVQLEPDQG
ncbi:hypothetical protein [Bradyrhizobium erythrophlei]|uniref:Permuted papain-like amidase enzyme, YaeF/YiiX, C92 family n=1 Tax=Bradyrhizobium erythrophlei TaxID=1437360 RepID=A0A1M5V7D1_9BRAD|nr:hypothetical protein [Bradyrhizobium erythrophlei]SHH70843.1 hypothetical protein SAMN05444169_8952 [Bradyrhizobium erythrophlei]